MWFRLSHWQRYSASLKTSTLGLVSTACPILCAKTVEGVRASDRLVRIPLIDVFIVVRYFLKSKDSPLCLQGLIWSFFGFASGMVCSFFW